MFKLRLTLIFNFKKYASFHWFLGNFDQFSIYLLCIWRSHHLSRRVGGSCCKFACPRTKKHHKQSAQGKYIVHMEICKVGFATK